MLLKRLITFVVVVPLCLLPMFVNAHHSVVVAFDTAKTSTITGVVIKV